MSVTMKDFKAYEASDEFLGDNQTKFVNKDSLEHILDTYCRSGELTVETVNQIMEDIENLSESR